MARRFQRKTHKESEQTLRSDSCTEMKAAGKVLRGSVRQGDGGWEGGGGGLKSHSFNLYRSYYKGVVMAGLFRERVTAPLARSAAIGAEGRRQDFIFCF